MTGKELLKSIEKQNKNIENKMNIHNNFDKFLKYPTPRNFCEFLLGHHGEQRIYDFKEEWQNWEKMSKHILGFSNHRGGGIIIGVKQNDDNTFEIKGLNKLKDKAEVDNLKKYLPDKLKYEVLDFHYPDNYKRAELAGKKFQVLLIEDVPTQIPFSSKVHGKDINQGTIYIRRIGRVEGATFDEVRDIVDRVCIETCSAKRLEHIKTYGKYNPTRKVIIEKDKYSPLEKFNAKILSFSNNVMTIEIHINNYFREKVIFGTGYYILDGIEGRYVIEVTEISEDKVVLLMGPYETDDQYLGNLQDRPYLDSIIQMHSRGDTRFSLFIRNETKFLADYVKVEVEGKPFLKLFGQIKGVFLPSKVLSENDGWTPIFDIPDDCNIGEGLSITITYKDINGREFRQLPKFLSAKSQTFSYLN